MKLPTPSTEQDNKHFVPAWLEEVRRQDAEATKEMTPDERIRYYQERAAEFQESQVTEIQSTAD